MGGDCVSYPVLYAQDATDFFSLGLGPMQNVLEAYVHEERNSVFYLELKMLTDKTIKENQIIRADAGHLLKDQRFVIKKITDNHDGTSEIYAEHVSYLTQELTLKPETRIVSMNAISALTAWKNAIQEDNPFVVHSDIETMASTYWRIDKVNNPRRALGGVDGSILDNWGGEYRFDNYQISLLKKRGTTAQTVLAYGRNITGFEMVTDIESVYTSIYPYAIHREDEHEELITIDGLVVDIENIENYPNRRTLPVDFSDKFNNDEIPTQARLVELAQQYITNNEVGVPKINIKVNFIDLSQTADYAEYKGLETVNLCDDVRIIYPSLGVDTVAKVTRIKWNVLTDSYDEIEIGEKRTTLGTQLNNKIEDLKQEVNTQINSSQLSADGKTTIFYGLYGEDGLGEPKANGVNDIWYQPNGEFVIKRRWSGTIWEIMRNTELEDNSITSDKIIFLDAYKVTAESLSAISANLGTVTAGYIYGVEIRGDTLIYLNDGLNNTVLSAEHGVSTSRTIAAKQQIRTEDWFYAGRTVDGTTTELGGFHGWRVMSNFVDPIQTNGTLAFGQRSTIDAKAVHYLDSTFKRYLNVDMALRFSPVSEQPPTAGMGAIWWGTAYAGTGLYVTSPSGQTQSLAIF